MSHARERGLGQPLCHSRGRNQPAGNATSIFRPHRGVLSLPPPSAALSAQTSQPLLGPTSSRQAGGAPTTRDAELSCPKRSGTELPPKAAAGRLCCPARLTLQTSVLLLGPWGGLSRAMYSTAAHKLVEVSFIYKHEQTKTTFIC